jgi:hypothetical protein
MMPAIITDFLMRYTNPRLRRNQAIIIAVSIILAYRLYYVHSDLFGIGYYILGAICTYIAASVFVGSAGDIIKEAKEAENK